MKHNSIFKTIAALDPDQQVIASAVGILRDGGLVVFPTTGLYGLGADAFDATAVKHLYRVKRRDLAKPILVLVKDVSAAKRICTQVPESAVRMMAAFWPGRLTIVLEAGPALPDVLTGGTGKIGIRVPRHPVAAAMVRVFNGPVTGTSANLSGRKGCASVSELDPDLIQGLDMVLDAGPLKGGTGSTVVDATVDPPVIMREGQISKNELFSL